MSWQDRRYDEQGERYGAGSGHPVATLWIVGLTIGVSALVWIFGGGLRGAGTQQIYDWLWLDTSHPFQIWRWLTCAFLHGDPMHVLLNMLMVFMVGRFIEASFGRKQFVVIYLSLAVFASLGLFLQAFVLGVPERSIGASGAAMGLVALLGSRFPMMELHLFGLLRLRCWVFAGALVLIDFLSLAANQGQESTARSVHLAGALGGFLYGFVWPRLGIQFEVAKTQRVKAKHQAKEQKVAEDQLELDQILKKINDQGMDALSSREREFLLAQSEKLKSDRK